MSDDNINAAGAVGITAFAARASRKGCVMLYLLASVPESVYKFVYKMARAEVMTVVVLELL